MSEPDLEAIFLGHLDPDRTKAEEKYLALRKKLILFFRSRNCADPEELADEAVMRAVKRCTEPLELENGFAAYVFGVAKFVLLEKYKKREPEALADFEVAPPPPVPTDLLPTEQTIHLRECLEHLTPQERLLLTSYIFEDRTLLAARTGLSPNALRVKICRIREKLTLATGWGSMKKGAGA